MRYHRAVLKGEETVRHEDDTSESALYSNSFVWEATVSLSCSGVHDFIIEAAPRGPKCVNNVPRWYGGQEAQVGKSHMQESLGGTRACRLRVPREEA